MNLLSLAVYHLTGAGKPITTLVEMSVDFLYDNP